MKSDRAMKTDLALLVGALIGSTITLIVAIAINATVANEPDNDYAANTGWALLMPAPAVSFVWTVVDILVYKLVGWYHPVYWLTTTIILLCLNAAMGGLGAAFWYWSGDFAWGAGMFTAMLALYYFFSMITAAVAVNHWREQKSARRPREDLEAKP